MFIAKSLVFYPGYFEDKCTELSDEVILPSHYLNRLIEEFDNGEMLYLSLTNTNTNLSTLVAIGSPHSYDRNTIFAPQWVLELIGCTGNCDSVITLQKANMMDIPAATKIVIRPLDSIAFELDTLACFEKAFMNLHSIKEGITIPVPVPELGRDYKMYAHIEKVEPASVARIVEGEVDVEFINDFATPIPAAINEPPPEFGSMITPPTAPSLPTQEEPTLERRRQQVRESWLKRFPSTAE